MSKVCGHGFFFLGFTLGRDFEERIISGSIGKVDINAVYAPCIYKIKGDTI